MCRSCLPSLRNYTSRYFPSTRWRAKDVCCWALLHSPVKEGRFHGSVHNKRALLFALPVESCDEVLWVREICFLTSINSSWSSLLHENRARTTVTGVPSANRAKRVMGYLSFCDFCGSISVKSRLRSWSRITEGEWSSGAIAPEPTDITSPIAWGANALRISAKRLIKSAALGLDPGYIMQHCS